MKCIFRLCCFLCRPLPLPWPRNFCGSREGLHPFERGSLEGPDLRGYEFSTSVGPTSLHGDGALCPPGSPPDQHSSPRGSTQATCLWGRTTPSQAGPYRSYCACACSRLWTLPGELACLHQDAIQWACAAGHTAIKSPSTRRGQGTSIHSPWCGLCRITPWGLSAPLCPDPSVRHPRERGRHDRIDAREMRGRFRTEELYVPLWLIHVEV